jgi:hypothetical protein
VASTAAVLDPYPLNNCHSRQLSYVGGSVTTTVEGVIPNGFAIENFPAEQMPHLGV